MRKPTIITLAYSLGIIVYLTFNQNGKAYGDEISSYIRKCCISGLRSARTKNECARIELAVSTIPRLWLGLCSSTFGVCCSRELYRQNCELGRLAALDGSKCENGDNTVSTSYTDCCRACQVGLAVKASQQKCRDPLFSFLSNIESYTICCSENNLVDSNENSNNKDTIYIQQNESQEEIEKYNIKDSNENVEGTIILTEDDDICGKISNLCEHICENTIDAYKCRCHPGFKLDENNVTCSLEQMQGGKCPRGYVIDSIQGKCVDIDECKDNIHECKATQYCHNIIGEYQCLNIKGKGCSTGYIFNIQSDECEDANECKQSPCEKGYECFNFPGGYDCHLIESTTCGNGFFLRNGSCVDIDECNNNQTNPCNNLMHQECKNTLGSYNCNCRSGYSLDVTQNSCVDINECSINNHNCLPTQRCDNTIGSYICTRWTSCGTGYTLNAESGNCDDDDECLLGTHNCQMDYDCYNTKGSFRCHKKTTTSTTSNDPPATASTSTTTSLSSREHSYYVANQVYNRLNYTPRYSINQGLTATSGLPCSVGFHRNNLGVCVDINECELYRPCKSHERCINTNGYYLCDSPCPVGYKTNSEGKSCVDINECETGDHNCGDKQICRNRNGGYKCECPIGHQVIRLLNGESSCRDINECEQDQPVCSTNAECFNTIGSFYCECKTGFKKKNGQDDSWHTYAQCLDVDECQTIPGLCQQKCVNFWGGYRCTCNSGYELSPDNRTCNDIDECDVHKDYKLCMGFCINSAGSYLCSCPRGYNLAADNSSCRDIDECETNTDNPVCTGQNDICTNIRGSYKCTTINCPHGYHNDPEQKNRCRQNGNFCDGEDCYIKPSAYTYNFITFVSKLIMPPDGRTIFTLRGPMWYDDIDFEFKIIRIQAAPNIQRATENYFDTLKSNNQVILILKKALEGPQDVEVDLTMTVFSNGMPRGKSVAKLFLFISQYTF